MRAVLPRYPSAIAGLIWTPLGSAGGFSGASVWRGDLADHAAFCLKAWPPGYPAERLLAVHRWMAAAERTGLVPAVVPTSDGETLVEYAGRVWDMTSWVTGTAVFRRDPSDARLAAACSALAALHRCWAPAVPTLDPCPGVQRRLAVLNEFADSLSRTGVGRKPPDAMSEHAFDLLRRHVPTVIASLRPWSERLVPVFPCLCDVWHDHVLFDGSRVTGIIDYGAMKIDHPAVDLARMLGDLVDGNMDRMRVGLDAYRDAGGPVSIDPDLVTDLDRTGLVCAVIHWLRRWEVVTAGDTSISERVSRLIGRLASLQTS
jgi:homoserine kinase type II